MIIHLRDTEGAEMSILGNVRMVIPFSIFEFTAKRKGSKPNGFTQFSPGMSDERSEKRIPGVNVPMKIDPNGVAQNGSPSLGDPVGVGIFGGSLSQGIAPRLRLVAHPWAKLGKPVGFGPRKLNFHRVLALFGLAGLALTFVGCATKQLQADFNSFADAYADSLNAQMLLNLARLDQGHPAYFLAIGEVRLSRTQSGSLSSTDSVSETTTQVAAANVSRTVARVLSGNLASSGSNSATPSFVFIPINSEESSRQLLAPISIEVFNTLFQQGWPADQLLRVLVERIEVEIREGGELRTIVLTNSPTRSTPESYARFLRVAEIVRALQRAGGLSLVSEDRFTATSSALVGTPSSKEVMDAADRGRTWQPAAEGEGEGWRLGTLRPTYRFQTDPALVRQVISSFETSTQPDFRESLDNLQNVLAATIGPPTIEASPRGQAPGTRSVLILRSFRNLLEAVAHEQRAFDLLLQDPTFRARVPLRQQRPVIRTDWTGLSASLGRPVHALKYEGIQYQIADPDLPATSEEARWNRDIFRLLVNLSSQVTVDITKFQRQTLDLAR